VTCNIRNIDSADDKSTGTIGLLLILYMNKRKARRNALEWQCIKQSRNP